MSTDAARRRRGPDVSRDVDVGDGAKRTEGHPHNKSFVGICMLIKIGLVLSVLVPVSLFVLYTYLVPAASYPVLLSLPDPPKLELNNILSSAEKLFEGQIIGPEAIIHHDGILYTSTLDGKIVRVVDGKLQTVAQIGKPPCGGYDNEPTCGRPLGLRFDADGYLVVCDPYYGLHKINVATGKVHLMLPSRVLINGRPLNFLNDLDIASDGTIYMSDSSAYALRDFWLNFFDGRPTGRLLKYDPVRNTTEVLLEGLNFAYGVQLSEYEDFVLVADLLKAKVIKYNLKGVNVGQSEVFAENLPSIPDRIRPSSSGGFWIGGPILRYEGKMLNGIDFMASRPWLRKLLSWLPYEKIMAMYVDGTMLLELNAQGEIVRTLMDRDGTNIRGVSNVEDVDGVLYIGSFSEPYIARIDSRKL